MTNLRLTYSNNPEYTIEDVLPEDLGLLKKKLKTQQSILSDKIKTVANPLLKASARSVHNEISKLRRKSNDRDSILELLKVSIETCKIVVNQNIDQYTAKDLMVYSSLTNSIKHKPSRAWKILAGAMISLTLVLSPPSSPKLSFLG